MSVDTIARLKITLDEVKPAVLRRIEVPFDIRLDRLHLVIQVSMGWTNSHLYELRVGGVGWGVPDPGWSDGPRDARKARLDAVLEDAGTRTLRYVYDFGDGWEHTIKIEGLADPVPGAAYPRLVAAVGCCPPEDSGGPFGYAELLDARNDPKHERHAQCADWFADGFDPEIVDVQWLTEQVAALAKRRSRKSNTPRSRHT